MILKKLFIATAAMSAVLAATSFGDVIHETTKWQSIGKETIKDGANTNSDNGVFYSLDNGTSWANLTDITEFTVGQSVDFRVDIWKEFQGTHYSDVAKVWIDGTEEAKGEWLLVNNGNYVWKNGVKYRYYDGNVVSNTVSQTAGKPELLGSMVFDYTFSEARTYELVARTMCSDDLRKLVTDSNPVNVTFVSESGNVVTQKKLYTPTAADWKAFTATSPLSTLQGEIEKYSFKVKDVPEPTMLSLFGFGLLSLAFFRRKK
jgi:uncharacterized protein YaiE (UPF0345 family)